jgi:hypothetical protein
MGGNAEIQLVRDAYEGEYSGLVNLDRPRGLGDLDGHLPRGDCLSEFLADARR